MKYRWEHLLQSCLKWPGAFSFDTARGEAVLFGGQGAAGFTGDTWVWNGEWWTERVVAGPSARYGGAMAFDESRGRAVLFGGLDASGQVGDTWEWDGSAWTRIVPTGGPSVRASHAMTYDAGRRARCLIGGEAIRMKSPTGGIP